MKDKVIWVDFSARKKGKNKIRKFLDKMLQNIKRRFRPSSKQNNKILDNYHKSIL